MGGVKMAMAETTDLTKQEAVELSNLRKQLGGIDSDMIALQASAENKDILKNAQINADAAKISAEAFTNQQERVNGFTSCGSKNLGRKQ